jgi:NAD(P)-dependent dehydrogenase (short-subunit alcohol dehydrogenase family)
MAWTTADIPDQTDRVAVVTGANGGLGLEVARELARKGGHVVMAARDQAKAEAARASIHHEVPDASLELQPLDLSSQRSVREAAAQILAGQPRIDILVNNAGVMATPHRRTADGFELQLGTNHFGHFALTGLLMPALADARVVTVSSQMHRLALRAPLGDPREHGRYNRWLAYGGSKLANLLFMRELDRRARTAGLGLTSVAAHPGYAATQLQTSGPRLGGTSLSARVMAAATPMLGQTPAMGALPSLYAATYPALAGGTYVGPSRLMEMRGAPKVVGMSRVASDDAAAARLWELSEEATGVTFLPAVT